MSPPSTAITQTDTATATATLQPLTRATLHSDDRFTAGPAKSKVRAVPGENPAARRLRASGISRNVGKASGTAIVAIARISTTFAPGLSKMAVGKTWTMSIDTKTPINTTGTVRSETSRRDRRNNAALFSSPKSSLGLFGTTALAWRRSPARSATGPMISTAPIARSTRRTAIRGSNNMNVNVSTAGFRDGDASINPIAGARRPDVSATVVNTGATQQEQSIKGVPASAPRI